MAFLLLPLLAPPHLGAPSEAWIRVLAGDWAASPHTVDQTDRIHSVKQTRSIRCPVGHGGD